MIFFWRSLLLKIIISSWRIRNWFSVIYGSIISFVFLRIIIWFIRILFVLLFREWGSGVRGMDVGVFWFYNFRFFGLRSFVFLILYFFWFWILLYILCFFGFYIVLFWNLDLDFYFFFINLDKWFFIFEIKRFFFLSRIELCFNLLGIVY